MVYCTESADDCDDLACDLATCQLLMLAGGGQQDQELIPDQDLLTVRPGSPDGGTRSSVTVIMTRCGAS